MFQEELNILICVFIVMSIIIRIEIIRFVKQVDFCDDIGVCVGIILKLVIRVEVYDVVKDVNVISLYEVENVVNI